MKNNYEVDVWWSEENSCYMAVAPDLPGCIADGETEQEVRREIDKSIKIWMEVNISRGLKKREPIYRVGLESTNDYQERINMLIAILMILAGTSEDKARKMLEDTYVYENILDKDEIVLHEGYLINTLDIISELKKKKMLSIASDKVYDLCQWMTENGIQCARQLREKYIIQKNIDETILNVIAVRSLREICGIRGRNRYKRNKKCRFQVKHIHGKSAKKATKSLYARKAARSVRGAHNSPNKRNM